MVTLPLMPEKMQLVVIRQTAKQYGLVKKQLFRKDVNQIIIATDADVDGMHIRLLLMTFFLQFFPDVIRSGHLYILQTPLFRVRNKKETRYCYSEEERMKEVAALCTNPEIANRGRLCGRFDLVSNGYEGGFERYS